MSEILELSEKIPLEKGGKRIDQVAAQLFPEYSREKVKAWILKGDLKVDGLNVKPRDKVLGGEMVVVETPVEAAGEWLPQDVAFPIIYEDEHIIVINKPAGLVVHPGAGTPDQTLLNGLLYRFPELAPLPRAGIVHRLDKDTSGLMVVARSQLAFSSLVEQLQDHSMGREYEAVVKGVMTGGGMVEEPIARHATQRIKMAVRPLGKEAITHYRILQKFEHHTHIRLKLETGRTHQIRVHMDYIHYPLVGDPVYGGQFSMPRKISDELKAELRTFRRQALHAAQLTLMHPAKDEEMTWEVELPEDMVHLLEVIAEESPDVSY